jgi:hypothetical protein
MQAIWAMMAKARFWYLRKACSEAFTLSLSKRAPIHFPDFDKLSPNGSELHNEKGRFMRPFSLSKLIKSFQNCIHTCLWNTH